MSRSGRGAAECACARRRHRLGQAGVPGAPERAVCKGRKVQSPDDPYPRISVILQAFCGPGGGIGVEKAVPQEDKRERGPELLGPGSDSLRETRVLKSESLPSTSKYSYQETRNKSLALLHCNGTLCEKSKL